MPVTYDVDPARNLVLVRMEGDVTGSDIAGYFTNSRADPRVSPSMSRLIDVRGATSLPKSEDVRKAAAMSRDLPLPSTTRLAFLVDSDLATGVMMMFGGLAGLRDSFSVFRDETEAREWLNAARRPAP